MSIRYKDFEEISSYGKSVSATNSDKSLYGDRQMLKKKLVSLGSNVTFVARNPSSCKKSKADLLNVLCDTVAIGTNAYLCDKSSYLTSLHVAPDSAALPAVIAVVDK